MSKRRRHKISTFSFVGNSFWFWLDAVLMSVSFFVLAADLFHLLPDSWNSIIFICISAVGLLPVLLNAVRALVNWKLTVDLLASIALIFSLLNKEFHSTVFIILMLASARFFAYFTETRTKRAIQRLLKLRPTKVLIRLNHHGVIEKEIEDVQVGDLVIIEAGERIAVDGVVVEGVANIDQSSLTGEFAPVDKKVGDEVFSSTLNTSGSLLVKTTKIGADTTFAKIVKLIEESQKGKAPISSVADKFVNFYILVTILGSAAIYFFTHNLILVLSILLVTCADDLAIALPLAFMATIGTAAKNGIIIKGASFIEGLLKMKMMIFDKTGTLTEGRPELKNIFVFKKYSEEKFLKILGGLNDQSKHLTARAIYNYTKQKNIKIYDIRQIHEEPGYGIEGVLEGKKVYGGNVKFLEKHNVEIPKKADALIKKEKSLGRMIVALGTEGNLIGFLSLADSIRHNAANVIKELRDYGVKRIVMLTGDNEAVAKEVADALGILEFKANLLPQDKVNFVKESINKKDKVGMLGDGANDAASLALADISFVMGAIGSDVSIEAADIALMRDNLSGVLKAIQLSRKTMTVIRQNLFLWGLINCIGLVLVFTGFFGPSAAAAYNFLTDFIPPTNSLKLLSFRRNMIK